MGEDGEALTLGHLPQQKREGAIGLGCAHSAAGTARGGLPGAVILPLARETMSRQRVRLWLPRLSQDDAESAATRARWTCCVPASVLRAWPWLSTSRRIQMRRPSCPAGGFGPVLVRFAPAERKPGPPLRPSLRLEPCLRLIRGRSASALLYRKDLPDHPCPWGLRNLRLRERQLQDAHRRGELRAEPVHGRHGRGDVRRQQNGPQSRARPLVSSSASPEAITTRVSKPSSTE